MTKELTYAQRLYGTMAGAWGLNWVATKAPKYVDLSVEIDALRKAIEDLEPLIPTDGGKYFGDNDKTEVAEALMHMHLPVWIAKGIPGINDHFAKGIVRVRMMITSLFSVVPDDADKQLITVAEALGTLCDKVIESAPNKESLKLYQHYQAFKADLAEEAAAQ